MTTKPFIIGIGHVQRVGKDVAASALQRELGFTRYGFADQLKELSMAADPMVTATTRNVNVQIGHGKLSWVVGGMGWEGAKDTYPEVRRFLQNLGSGARATFGEDFWVDQLFAKINRMNSARIVIPDVRYVNEVAAIKNAGGYVIRVNRPGAKAFGHESETELMNFTGWDEEFDNDREIDYLEKNVVSYVKNLIDVKLVKK